MARWRQKKWRITDTDRTETDRLRAALGCSSLSARLLVNRGLSDPDQAAAFLAPSFSQLPDPFLLPDAEAAAERLKRAVKERERIYIHGDYDGDGVTSAALWTRLLEALGADVMVHVPHRRRDGYDMRSKFVAEAKNVGAKLILTTDCGIQRCEEVEEARELGIDVIITDHHEPGPQIPRAVAVVNPHRKDSRYPFPYLAGVGVAFRVGEALVRQLGLPVDSYRRAYSDLAAIGTITDIMPVLGENRILVKHGLAALQETRKPGLKALIESAGLTGKTLSTHSIGFHLGPRINAVGRIDDSRVALDLLLSRDAGQAAQLAAQLERCNEERRQEQSRILEEAEQLVLGRSMESTSCLVLSAPNWHSGVIGIVANKLVERYNRPTVLIAVDPESGLGRGSARSIRPFDLYQAIVACSDHLLEFGGHAHAAGLSIHRDAVDTFAEAINRYAADHLSEEDFVPLLEADLEAEAGDITLGLLRELEMFEPWGRGNEEPVIVSRNLEIGEVRRIGKDQSHLKMRLRGRGLAPTDAVMWSVGEWSEYLAIGDTIDICYRPNANTYNGRTSVQFMLQDLRPAGMDDW